MIYLIYQILNTHNIWTNGFLVSKQIYFISIHQTISKKIGKRLHKSESLEKSLAENNFWNT